MKLVLVGKSLSHSWLKQIHSHFVSTPYELIELKTSEELKEYILKKDYDGLNVAFPYCVESMQYLDELDEIAEKVGAVNYVVNKDGKLIGYNTNYLGFKKMLEKNEIDVNDKQVAVLGTGASSKAVTLALKELGAHITLVSREKSDDVITYEELYESESKYEVIINTTVVGLYPNTDEKPIEISKFTNVKTVIDIIANPLRTRLLYEAKGLGLQTLGGFEMLVRVAAYSDELVLGKKFSEEEVDTAIKRILNKRKNIAFIGMPTAGKTTISQYFAKAIDRDVYEMDDEIVDKLGTSIQECFQEKGEPYFRKIESEVAKEHKEAEGNIISCGGGVVKIEETMRYLSENGTVVWIKRDLENLFPTDSRPLSSSENALKKLYEERMPLYTKYSDIEIENNGTIEETIEQILNGIEELRVSTEGTKITECSK